MKTEYILFGITCITFLIALIKIGITIGKAQESIETRIIKLESNITKDFTHNIQKIDNRIDKIEKAQAVNTEKISHIEKMIFKESK